MERVVRKEKVERLRRASGLQQLLKNVWLVVVQSYRETIHVGMYTDQTIELILPWIGAPAVAFSTGN